MFRVRFNLSKGIHFMKWKVHNTATGDIQYVDPAEVVLVMKDCILHNNRLGADRIFNGHSKFVVAYIQCSHVDILTEPTDPLPTFQIKDEVSYNPRIKPYWVKGDENVDGSHEPLLTTLKTKVYSAQL